MADESDEGGQYLLSDIVASLTQLVIVYLEDQAHDIPTSMSAVQYQYAISYWEHTAPQPNISASSFPV